MDCKKCKQINVEECDHELCDFEVPANCITVDLDGLDCIDIETDTLQAVLVAFCELLSESVIGGSGDADWFVAETTDVPTEITDSIYHTGNVGIGLNNPEKQVDTLGSVQMIFEGDEGFTKILNDDLDIDSLMAGVDGIIGQFSTLIYQNDDETPTEQAGIFVGNDTTLGTIAEMYAQTANNTSAIAIIPTLVTFSSDDGTDDTDFSITSTNIIIDGSNGFTGTVANPTSITVVKGIVTNVT